MTQEEKAYNKALERARMYHNSAKEAGDYSAVARYENIFPELRESEDERIRKKIIDIVKASPFDEEKDVLLAWLEKQKEPKPNIELIQRSWYMEGYHDRQFNMEPKWTIKAEKGGPRYYENPNYGKPLEQKEPKPVEIHNPTDEEVESWKNELTEFKKFATKQAKENQLHISYTRDVMWENFCSELLSFVNSRKPAEWSEEDEKMMKDIDLALRKLYDASTRLRIETRLKSLRPSWKPNEQEKAALRTAIFVLTEERNFPKAAEHLQDILNAFEQVPDYKVGDKISWKGKEYTIDACYPQSKQKWSEEDRELAWEDIRDIDDWISVCATNCEVGQTSEDIYEEVLRRFKEGRATRTVKSDKNCTNKHY